MFSRQQVHASNFGRMSIVTPPVTQMGASGTRTRVLLGEVQHINHSPQLLQA